MRFSILLPTHNRPETLGFAIRSVLEQTVADWELLVVGDGCTDHTADVVTGFGDPRIRWFDLPKAAGFGYANRNIALRQARGDLIAFLGHDNLLFTDHLAQMDAAFADRRVQFAYSRPLWIRDDGVIVAFFVNLSIRPPWKDFMERRNVIPATCVVHRRAVFDAVGYWPETLERNGDWDLWKRILDRFGQKSGRLVAVPTNLHFRANWRPDRNWGAAPANYLYAMYDNGTYWPPQLDLKLSDGSLPQAQVWEAMEAEPALLVQQIRQGVDLLQDHLSWNAGLVPGFR